MNTETAWAAIMAAAARPQAGAIRARFAADPGRAGRLTYGAAGLLADLSRTSLDETALAALLGLAEATGVAARRGAMARGDKINATEGRAVLHMALRQTPRVGGAAENADVAETLSRMRTFATAVRDGTILGAKGDRFTDVLNIGIGGSDLGPAMAARALARPGDVPRAHFLANVDGHAWAAVRETLDPARTLVLIASKTFTTQETMANARLVRAWLVDALGEEGASTHLAALSTNAAATAAFGIPPERVFGFNDWVGGRFSLWSAIGLSLALALGWDRFEALLGGARAMDEHFLSAPPEANLPLLLACVDVWHGNAMGHATRAVLPYDERLGRLPAHLQQLEMESLGKRVGLD
ncbi:MAG: glucose-6-phosphate isomerase, partial [Pseudomonadota bacterium]